MTAEGNGFEAFETAWNQTVDAATERLAQSIDADSSVGVWRFATPELGEGAWLHSVMRSASRALASRWGLPWVRIDLDGYEPGGSVEAFGRYLVASRAVERDLQLEIAGVDQLRQGAEFAAWISIAIDLAVDPHAQPLPTTGSLVDRIRALGRVVLFIEQFDELPATLRATLQAALRPNPSARGPRDGSSLDASASDRPEGVAFVVAARMGPAPRSSAVSRGDDLSLPTAAGLFARVDSATRRRFAAEGGFEEAADGASSPDPAQHGIHGLLDALALAGGRLPFQPLLDGVGLGAAEVARREDLIDTVDDRWVDELGLLDDLEFHHPSFQDGVYRLAASWLPRALERTGRAERAAAARRSLADLQRTRGLVATLARLDWAAGEDERARRLRCRLACWVVEAEAADLPAAVRACVEAGEFQAEDLFRLIADGRGWPLGRRRAALEAWRSLPENEAPVRRIEALLLAGELERAAGRLDDALRHTREAIELTEETVGPASRSFVQALHQSAAFLAETGRLEDAREQIEFAETLIDQLLEPADRLRVAIPHTHARILRGIGELRRAREPLERAVGEARQQRGAQAPEVALLRRELAALLGEVGELEASETVYRQTLDETDFGPRDVIRAALLYDLAGLKLRQGESADGRTVALEALEQADRAFGKGDPQTLPFLQRAVDTGSPDDPRQVEQAALLAEIRAVLEAPIERAPS